MDDARARDVVLRGILGTMRNGHDAAWCKRKLVKPLRKLLAPTANVAHIGPEMERARAEAEASVIKFCGMCDLPNCKRDKCERAAE
jgi:hypothetical protein